MKRFILFGGYEYYAQGGLYDFRGSYDDKDSAVRRAEELESEDLIGWWHIYDKEVNTIADQGEGRAYGTDGEFLNDVIN